MKTFKAFLLLASVCLIAANAKAQGTAPAANKKITVKPKPCTPKPKNWSVGKAITVTAYSPNTKKIVCIGESVDLSVTATDQDRWEIRCKEDNRLREAKDAADQLTYSWTGGGTFTSSTAASTKWQSPTAGEFTLTVTVDDKATLATGETGTRSDGPATKNVEVCVVDPGTKPTSVTAVDYREIPGPKPVTTRKIWGLTGTSPGILTIEAYFDCDTKRWKCVVTNARSIIDVWISEDRTEPNDAFIVTGAPDDRDFACTLIQRLPLGVDAAAPYWPRAATVAHEAAHVAAWKQALSAQFGIFQTTVEGMSLPYECGQTANDAKTLFEGDETYRNALQKMNDDADAAFQPNQTHADGLANAAGQAAANARVTEIRNLVAQQGWTACP